MENILYDKNNEKLSKLIMEAGEVMLKSGGEISRVEENMKIIAKAYGASANVYTLSNGLFLTLYCEGDVSTFVKEVPISAMNLGQVVQVNNLSRDISEGRYTVEEAFAKLNEIKKLPLADEKIRVFFAGLAGGSFSYLFGGDLYDFIAAFIASGLLYIFTLFAINKGFPKFLRIVVGSALATFASQILFSLGLGNDLDHIIIGAIITMVPGVTLTISIREFIFEDYLSGSIHLVDALLTSMCIAVGVITMFEVYKFVF